MNSILDQYLTKSTWKTKLSTEFTKEYFQSLTNFLSKEYETDSIIYPPQNAIFEAFHKTPWEDLKVVLLGQDPYHNPNQAMGLSFSVPANQKIPPSLRNIYKELQTDLDIPMPNHGDLSTWGEQGVLLLNSVLTVEKNKPGSHKNQGWEIFTDAVIQLISDEKEGIVFLLWGNYAKQKGQKIDRTKHLVLEAAHPSPLGRGKFFGSQPFSQTNEYLLSIGKQPIDWSSISNDLFS